MYDHIRFSRPDQGLVLLDQRLLPGREEYVCCRSTDDIIVALKDMIVRGAPAIGVTAAYGCWLASRESDPDSSDWRDQLKKSLDRISQARPTAVNLQWAVERMRRDLDNHPDLTLMALRTRWLDLARDMHRQDIEINRAIGRNGAGLFTDGDRVMTHCNAGALATAGYGTALGVIRAAVEEGKHISVISNETRPFLQGARLTAYELNKDAIPVTIACDNACGLLMSRGLVDKVVTGADRIAANGDTANKIGTYMVAAMAKRHDIPFYIAAPLSTIDLATPNGQAIAIEERPDREVTHIGETRITPENVPVYNFAFDITPAELISGIITEHGVLRPPYRESIYNVMKEQEHEPI